MPAPKKDDFEFAGGLIPSELKKLVTMWTYKNPTYNMSDAILLGLAHIVGASEEKLSEWMLAKKGNKKEA